MKYNSKCGRYHTYIGHVVFNDTMSKFKDEDSWFVDVVSKDKYIVDEDPNIEEEVRIFQDKKKQFEEWQMPSPPKKKRGRPKKK